MASCRNLFLLMTAYSALTRAEDECTLVQNNVQQVPSEMANMAVQMNKEMGGPPPAATETGPFVFTSGTGAVRLPDNMPSWAWGADKAKALRAEGIVGGDVTGGHFISLGTDGKSTHHALAGAGFVGMDKKHNKPTAGGVLSAASVEPDKIEVVNAAPSQTNGIHDGGWDWAKLKAQVRRGHFHLPQKSSEAHANMQATSGEPAPTTKDHEPEALANLRQDNESEALDNEEQAKLNEFNLYTLQLMLMDFPYPSALVFTIFRAWCRDNAHALLPQEESQRLRGIEGRYQIVLDSEFPNSTGSIMVIENSTIVSPFGKSEGNVTVRAYKEDRYAAIFPMKAKTSNSTVEVYRMFKMNGTRLEWDGGNLWQRLAPAPEANAAAAPAGRPGKVQSLLKVLGKAPISRQAEGKPRKEIPWVQLQRDLAKLLGNAGK